MLLRRNRQFVERRLHALQIGVAGPFNRVRKTRPYGALAWLSPQTIAGLVDIGCQASPCIEPVSQMQLPFHRPRHGKQPLAVRFVPSLDSIALRLRLLPDRWPGGPP